MKDFASSLPRLTDLHDRFVSDRANNFFRRFPYRLATGGEATTAYYAKIESWLGFVPKSEWDSFTLKVGAACDLRDHRGLRDWEKLHDVFNESLGAKMLRAHYGCRELRLVSAEQKRAAPDWRGVRKGRPRYLEVKTINNSDDERESWMDPDESGPDRTLAHTVFLPAALKKKVADTVKKASKQLHAPADSAASDKTLLLVLKVDYNVDPMDQSIEDLVLPLLKVVEPPDIEILCRIETVN